MCLGTRWSLLDVDCRAGPIDRDDFAERRLILQANLVSGIDLHFLWRIPVSVDDRSRRSSRLAAHGGTNAFDERHAGDRVTLVEEIFFSQVAKAKVFPPSRLVLASMVVEHVCEQPSSLLLVAALGSNLRPGAQQSGAELVALLCALVDRDWRSAVGQQAPRYLGTRRLQLGTDALEPPMQPQRRDAIVAIVTLDQLPRFLRDGFRRPRL